VNEAPVGGGGAPRIEFPCDYPVKVMGENGDDFVDLVVGIGQRHAPELTEERVSVRASRNARWVSVTMTIRATGEAQLRDLFEELKATGRTQLVL
jgi:putative lipoic acid-binding regulatory protein